MQDHSPSRRDRHPLNTAIQRALVRPCYPNWLDLRKHYAPTSFSWKSQIDLLVEEL
jgi:hypothetical protein